MKTVSSLFLMLLLVCVGCSNEQAAETNEIEEQTTATPGSGSDDLATAGEYELSMDRVDRYLEANRNMAVAFNSMTPEEQEQAGSVMNAANASLDEHAANIDANPVAREAIADAGLTSREFALIMMSMLQSGMAMAFIEMQPNADPDSIARAMQVNPDNITFMRENASEIETKSNALQAELERMGMSD